MQRKRTFSKVARDVADKAELRPPTFAQAARAVAEATGLPSGVALVVTVAVAETYADDAEAEKRWERAVGAAKKSLAEVERLLWAAYGAEELVDEEGADLPPGTMAPQDEELLWLLRKTRAGLGSGRQYVSSAMAFTPRRFWAAKDWRRHVVAFESAAIINRTCGWPLDPVAERSAFFAASQALERLGVRLSAPRVRDLYYRAKREGARPPGDRSIYKALARGIAHVRRRDRLPVIVGGRRGPDSSAPASEEAT